MVLTQKLVTDRQNPPVGQGIPSIHPGQAVPPFHQVRDRGADIEQGREYDKPVTHPKPPQSIDPTGEPFAIRCAVAFVSQARNLVRPATPDNRWGQLAPHRSTSQRSPECSSHYHRLRERSSPQPVARRVW